MIDGVRVLKNLIAAGVLGLGCVLVGGVVWQLLGQVPPLSPSTMELSVQVAEVDATEPDSPAETDEPVLRGVTVMDDMTFGVDPNPTPETDPGAAVKAKVEGFMETFHGPSTVIPCERDGQAGITVAKDCIIPSDTVLRLDTGSIVLLPEFADYTSIEKMTLRGEIASLDGLLQFPALKELTLDFLKVEDTSALADLGELRKLVMHRTNISDVAFMRDLPMLEELKMSDSPIADLAPLATLPVLTELRLSEIPAQDISHLSTLITLEQVGLMQMTLPDITPLSGLENLRRLDLSYNDMPGLDPLGSLTRLTRLRVEDSGVADVAPLAGLTNLQSLELSDNPITDVRALAPLDRLGKLDLSYTQVADVSMLPDIRFLSLSRTPAAGN